MERPLKRQQRTVGAIVKIPLEESFHTYARILKSKFAFYDCRTKDDIDIETIVSKPALFFTNVYDSAVTKGYWLKVGKKLPLEEHLLDLPPVYIQDALNPSKYQIFKGKEIRTATKEECIGLECLSAWSYENVEHRLNDHYAGRENLFVKFMLNADIQSYFLSLKSNVEEEIIEEECVAL
jgi:hypothetical protein